MARLRAFEKRLARIEADLSLTGRKSWVLYSDEEWSPETHMQNVIVAGHPRDWNPTPEEWAERFKGVIQTAS